MRRKLLALIPALLLTGCVSTYYTQDAEAVFRDSPRIESLVKEKPAARTTAANIESYYFWWNPLTRPDAVRNWKEIFVMGESSSPAWPYLEIARVDVAQRTRDDAAAMQTLRALASSMGGDALIDLRRDPMIDGPKFGSKIIGFHYLATVVRKN